MACAHSEENSYSHNWKQPRQLRVSVCVYAGCRQKVGYTHCRNSREQTTTKRFRILAFKVRVFLWQLDKFIPWSQHKGSWCESWQPYRCLLGYGVPRAWHCRLAGATKCNYANEQQLFWEFNSQCTHTFTQLFTYSFQLEQYYNQAGTAVKCPP